MKFFIKLGTASDTPETPDTPPTENAPLPRGAATEIEEIHQYIYAGGKLLRETISDGTTTKTLDFTYDNVGMPYSLIYNDGTTTTKCYYITNLQGDVMYLVDANGVQVAAYDYDPYGKVITATGTMAEINSLRYRGYYYDTETSFYYLQSRYYDPEICRFINADSYVSTGDGFTGFNMFAYCNNNPVNRIDPDGHDSSVVEWWMSTMWWLCGIDGPVPVGDIVYLGVAVSLCIYAVAVSSSSSATFYNDVTILLDSTEPAEASEAIEPTERRNLPLTGEPNSDANLLNPDGTVKQTRHYDQNGNAEYDIDYNHADSDKSHIFPHMHTWTNGTRSKGWIPLPY